MFFFGVATKFCKNLYSLSKYFTYCACDSFLSKSKVEIIPGFVYTEDMKHFYIMKRIMTFWGEISVVRWKHYFILFYIFNRCKVAAGSQRIFLANILFQLNSCQLFLFSKSVSQPAALLKKHTTLWGRVHFILLHWRQTSSISLRGAEGSGCEATLHNITVDTG